MLNYYNITLNKMYLNQNSMLHTLMYSFGPKFQDRRTPKTDDGASPEIPISVPFSFYDTSYRSLYVNNNGVVSFGVPVNQFTPDSFPLSDGRAFVAPFWADVDNRITGEVYYRQSQDPQLLQKVTADINAYFAHEEFTATWLFVATWDRVTFYGSQSSKVNTFQVVLTTDGNRSFIMLHYSDIQWTTGVASGGNPHTGVGGTPAQAGFNSGGSKKYFNIPGSQTPNILKIVSMSNIKRPGRWAFQVDSFAVPNGCVYNGSCCLLQLPVPPRLAQTCISYFVPAANFLPPGTFFWSDQRCERRCQCMYGDDRVTCQAQGCSLDEVCHPAAWYHVCQPVNRAACRAWGGRLYTTFDGRRYHFQGACTHVLSQLCASPHPPGLAPFRVEAETEEPGASQGAPSPRSVQVTVYGQNITMARGATGHVMVS
ncbi:alpha-tectorin-like [Carettochelys insculpta]|uniref:alpha-tectorin-like n=1 Tax=Carettochelys insculpta TaxID=44489 RepID=UPI003EB9CF68